MNNQEQRNFTIRMPLEVHVFVLEQSKMERVSMNNWLLRLVDQKRKENAPH